MKYAGILLISSLVLIGPRSAKADLVLGSFTANSSDGGNSAFFQGTFLFQDSIGACDPEICNNLLPVLNANVAPTATAPLTFVTDAANNPNWTTITSLLQNNASFFKVCDGFSPSCSSFFANTVGNQFFPNGGSFANDTVSAISFTLNPLVFDISPGFDTVTYTESVSVIGSVGTPEPSPASLIAFGVVVLLLSGVFRSLNVAVRKRLDEGSK
jgi:hypothetical protein